MVKGLIASLQEKSERTVRQHAVAVYRKAGLSGRAQLSAFFLEDLLLSPPRWSPPVMSSPMRSTEFVAGPNVATIRKVEEEALCGVLGLGCLRISAS